MKKSKANMDIGDESRQDGMGLSLRVVKRGQLTLIIWLTKKSTVDQKSIVVKMVKLVIFVMILYMLWTFF